MKRMERQMSRLWIGVGIAAAVTLVFLAWIQFRWITQVRDAERDRLRARATADVQQIAAEVDTEITRTIRALVAGRPDPEAAGDRYSRWRETATDAQLVRTIYLFERGQLLEFDRKQQRFEPRSWPRQLAALHERMTVAMDARPPLGLVMDPATPAFAVIRRPPQQPPEPGFEAGVGPGPRRGFGPPPGTAEQQRDPWFMIEFDSDFVRTHWLPALIDRILRPAGDSGYAVRVLTNDDARRVLYASPSAGISFASPDVSAPLLTIRIGPGGGPGRPGMMGAMMGRPGAPFAAPLDTPPGWLIEVKHRSGSFENAVASSRRVNLAISGATLLLMAAAFAVVLFTTRRAQALAASQMEFVAGVSHELRTPLTVICSAADNLADGIVTNETGVRRYGSVIRAEGRRLAAMVEQILRFAGIQSGRTIYDPQPVAVDALLERAIAACDLGGCTVEKKFADGLPAVLADTISLTHALRNVIDNAVVHGGEGKWVGISAVPVNGSVEIAVEDRGPGIPANERALIFDPFYRGRRALDNQIHGFGLGLALVKRIVDAQSGSVGVDSGPSGTIVRIRMPAVPKGANQP